MNASSRVCGDHQYPEEKPDISASTGRGTGPMAAGGVHHGGEQNGPGCVGDDDH